MPTAKEIQERIEQLRKEIADITEHRPFRMDSSVQIAQRQSEVFVAPSQLVEISSRRTQDLTEQLITSGGTMERFTRWLIILTFVLCIIGGFQIILMFKGH